MTFEEAWALKMAEGYQYGEEALQNVRFGWEIAVAVMNQAPKFNLENVSKNPWEPWREMIRTYDEGDWISVEDLPV